MAATQPITSTTLAERQEGVKRIRAGLRGRKRERFDSLTEAQQLAFADKVLKSHGRRNKAGAIDWDQLMKFIKFLFDLLAPLFIKQ